VHEAVSKAVSNPYGYFQAENPTNLQAENPTM